MRNPLNPGRRARRLRALGAGLWWAATLAVGADAGRAEEETEREPIPAEFTLSIPEDADDVKFAELMDGRTDWRHILCRRIPSATWFAAFAECPGLEVLTLNCTGERDPAAAVPGRDLEVLARCRMMRELFLNLPVDFGGGTLGRLAAAWPGLETFEYFAAPGSTPPGDDALAALAAACPRLRRVELFGAPGVGDKALAALGRHCPELRRFFFVGDPADVIEGAPRAAPAPADNVGALTADGVAALAGCGRLESLALIGAPRGADALTALIARNHPALTELGLSVELDDEGLARLGALTKLTDLYLMDASRLTEAGFAKALAAWPALESVELERAAHLGDAALRALADRPELHRVSFAGDAATPEGEAEFRRRRPDADLTTERLAALRREEQERFLREHEARLRRAGRTLDIPRDADLDQLDDLFGDRADWLAVDCWSPHLTDAILETILRRCPDLEAFNNLNVNPAGLTPDGAARFALTPKLRELRLCFASPLTDDAFAAILAGCPELEVFDVCDDGPAALTERAFPFPEPGRAARLRHLELRAVRPGAEDAFCAAVAMHCPELREFDLGSGEQARLTADGLAALAACGRLESVSLNVDSPDGLNAGWAALAEGCPALRAVFAYGAPADDGTLAVLADAAKLDSLFLAPCEAVTDEGVGRLAALPRLDYLHLMEANGLADAALGRLGASPSLAVVTLDSPGFTDAGLAALAEAGAVALRHLNLTGADAITDDGVVALAALPELRELILGKANHIGDDALLALSERRSRLNALSLPAATGVTDAGVIALAGRCVDLTRLDLDAATTLTDRSLDALAECSNIYIVSLKSAAVTPEGVARFRERKPDAYLTVPPVARPLPPARGDAAVPPPPPVDVDIF